MGVKRLNHAVLYVRDVDRSVAFYRKALGFEVVTRLPGAAFMNLAESNNDHDLGFFEVGKEAGANTAGRGTVGLYHLAWEVETLGELAEIARRLEQMGALAGASDHGTTKAIYAHDPDGIEFEVSWLVPIELIDEEALRARTTTRRLDLDQEIARYGGETLGLRSVVYEERG